VGEGASHSSAKFRTAGNASICGKKYRGALENTRRGVAGTHTEEDEAFVCSNDWLNGNRR